MMRWRPLFLSVHRWTGLALGILLVIQGLTGASLVFRQPIDRLIHPSTVVTPATHMIAVQAMLDTVRRAHADMKVTRIDMPDTPDGTALFHLNRQDGASYLAAVDPWRGAIVRQGGLLAWPTEWLFEIHETLAAGDTGATLVGVEGIALILLALTGPIIWWPGLRRWRNGFRLWRNAGIERFVRGLHRSGGVILALVLVFSATTGTLMAFKGGFRSMLRLAGPVIDKPAPTIAEQLGRRLLPVDTIVAAAKQRYGATRLQQLRFPGGSGRVVTVYLDADRSKRPEAAKQIWHDGYNGRDLGQYVAGTLPAGNEAVDWLFPLHTGAAGGVLLKLVLLAGGLGLAGMSASGIYLWVARRFLRRRASRPVGTPRPVEA